MKRRSLVWGSLGALLFCAVFLTSAARGQDVSFFSFFTGWPPDSYELDSVERIAERPGRPDCDTASLVRYRGDKIRYRRPARVHSAFVPRLARFESLVTQLAIEHYGRAPRRLRHRGAFNCRIARGRRARISEHAFGNALDLQGFEFPALPRGEELPANMPPRMRRSFSITVLEHWTPRRRRDAYHAEFLHRVTDALRVRPDIFRGIVGPPRPRHRDHLHLDASPWRYAMYAYERAE
ncbi:MAG: extensin family protein [Polyangiales bacterium]